VLPQLQNLKRAALDLLFPQRCLGCGEEGELLCRSCLKTLPQIFPPVCPRCGRPQTSEILCPACVGWQTSIDCIRSPLKFEGLVRQAIHQFKYKNLRSLDQPLGLILKDYFYRYPLPVEIVVHPKRMRERGYNQSELLARQFASLLHLPLNITALKRINYIKPQVRTQSALERRQNIQGAFACSGPVLKQKRVLLIDDVSTSGATLDACAAALKYNGSGQVYGLVVARDIMILGGG
jgi:ComF family protein